MKEDKFSGLQGEGFGLPDYILDLKIALFDVLLVSKCPVFLQFTAAVNYTSLTRVNTTTEIYGNNFSHYTRSKVCVIFKEI